jgi:hypothetical protein
MKLAACVIVLLSNLLAIPVVAKNVCACIPEPSTKKYIGEARKKHTIGYSIDWTCRYQCKLDPRDEDSSATSVNGTYHEFHIGQEDGREGVCEGMVFKAQYNSMLNREIYMYTGENQSFSPSESKANELNIWSQSNNCE